MNEIENMVPWADWVLLEACNRAGLTLITTIEDARAIYQRNEFCRALCGMIAKHEQPPVDPETAAVRRIIAKWEGWVEGDPDIYGQALERAVAQYKQERGQ